MKIVSNLLFIFILISPEMLTAQQQDCALKLREAQALYNSGKIERVPELLEACLQSGFTRDEKITAYKLLINACIFDDNLSSAEMHMSQFLRKFPDYEPSAADPALFISLMDEFDNRPRYNIGISGGTNISDIRPIEYYGVHDVNTVKGKYSSSGFGFQAGVGVSKFIGKRYEAGLEPAFIQFRYNYNLNPFPFAIVEYSEIQNNLVFPLTFSMDLSQQNFAPYLKTAFVPRLLLSATSTTTRNYENTGTDFFNEIKGPETDITNKRNQLNYGLSFGGGLKYKISSGCFFINVSYHCALLNDVVAESRKPANDDLSLVYFFVVNDFRPNYITLSAGFSYSFYKPKKL